MLRYFLDNLEFSVIGGDSSINLASAQIPQMFYETANRTGIFDDISASMTDRIRHNSNDKVVVGAVLRSVTYIQVDWAWISPPVVAVVLSSVVLVVTVWKNHKSGAPPWKDELMPLLFLGFEGWEQHRMSAWDEENRRKVARGMQARLRRNINGDVRFVPGTYE